jgi:ribonuclease VapC
MIIDTSAIIAILLNEPEAEDLIRHIVATPRCKISAFSLLETGIVIEAKKGPAGGRELDLFIHKAGIEIVSLDEEQSQIALDGWRKFGKGRHPAALNIGDCCSYALAMHSGEPLLFKSDDFVKTDAPLVDYQK